MVPIIGSIVAFSGCARPRGNYQHSQTIVARDSDCLWEAIQETLRRSGFRLDRVDPQTGVVSTLPETSQHFFEIWRCDVNSRTDFWEASLNPMRRWVEVHIARRDDASNCDLSVIVHKERLSSLDRQFNSTGAVYQYFGEHLPATTGKEKVTAEDDLWVDRGRDEALEEYLLLKIVDRAGKSAGS